MLALIASRLQVPVEEPIDRDPGLITLAASVLRIVTRAYEAGFRRQCALISQTLHHTH